MTKWYAEEIPTQKITITGIILASVIAILYYNMIPENLQILGFKTIIVKPFLIIGFQILGIGLFLTIILASLVMTEGVFKMKTKKKFLKLFEFFYFSSIWGFIGVLAFVMGGLIANFSDFIAKIPYAASFIIYGIAIFGIFWLFKKIFMGR